MRTGMGCREYEQPHRRQTHEGTDQAAQWPASQDALVDETETRRESSELVRLGRLAEGASSWEFDAASGLAS